MSAMTQCERASEFYYSSTAIHNFFSTLYQKCHEGTLEVRALGGYPASMWYPITSKGFTDAIAYSHRMEQEGADVYFGVNPRTYGGRDDASVVCAAALWTDLDGVGDEAAAWEKLVECRGRNPSPDAAVFSGRGLHLYWVLNHPIEATSEDIGFYLRGLRVLSQQYGGDIKCTNLSRIMRFPGTVNRKNGERAKVWIAGQH